MLLPTSHAFSEVSSASGTECNRCRKGSWHYICSTFSSTILCSQQTLDLDTHSFMCIKICVRQTLSDFCSLCRSIIFTYSLGHIQHQDNVCCLLSYSYGQGLLQVKLHCRKELPKSWQLLLHSHTHVQPVNEPAQCIPYSRFLKVQRLGIEDIGIASMNMQQEVALSTMNRGKWKSLAEKKLFCREVFIKTCMSFIRGTAQTVASSA